MIQNIIVLLRSWTLDSLSYYNCTLKYSQRKAPLHKTNFFTVVGYEGGMAESRVFATFVSAMPCCVARQLLLRMAPNKEHSQKSMLTKKWHVADWENGLTKIIITWVQWVQSSKVKVHHITPPPVDWSQAGNVVNESLWPVHVGLNGWLAVIVWVCGG